MNVKNVFISTDWHKKWVVNGYSILSTSFTSRGYANMVKYYNRGLLHNFYISDNGSITCYQSAQENDSVGNYIAKKIKDTPSSAKKLSNELLKKCSHLKLLMLQPRNLFKLESFLKFSEEYFALIPPFVAIIRCGSFLTDFKYKNQLKLISKTRVQTETILIYADVYLKKFLKLIAKKEKTDKLDLSVLTWNELFKYIKTKKLPNKTILKLRSSFCGYVYIKNKEIFLNKSAAKELSTKIANIYKVKRGFVKGQATFRGLVKGKVRIIQNPKNIKIFNKGDILFTGMTRPEFLPLIKKAGAIVTDAGGVLCHAAIVARELKKPCITGTQNATLSFKNGDMVEVDANKGIVKILKKR